MSIDDSYELRRQLILSSRIGVTFGADGLESDGLGFYDDGGKERIEAELKRDATELLGEPAEASFHAMGRSAGWFEVLLWVTGGVFVFLTKAKSLEDGVITVRRWAGKIRDWQKKLTNRNGYPPRLAVEALKVLCVDDLFERFGQQSEPVAALIRTQAASTRQGDGTWVSFAPVYVFIPDRRQDVTHLYGIRETGEIVHRSTIPAFELQEPEAQFVELPLALPDRSVDPDVERWEQFQKDYETEHAAKEKLTAVKVEEGPSKKAD